jgi:putative copper export protein
MNNLVFIAFAVGLSCGAYLGYRLGKFLAFKLSKQSIAPRVVRVCSVVCELLIVLPALYISFIVGGNLGGGWGEVASNSIGLGSIGVPIGLAVGIAIIFSGCLALGALVGGVIGRLFTYALPKSALTRHSSGTG